MDAARYNPRSGETNKLGSFNNSISRKLIPPTCGYAQDWILIIDNSAKSFKLLT